MKVLARRSQPDKSLGRCGGAMRIDGPPGTAPGQG